MNEYILLVLHKKGRSLSAFSLLDNSMIFDIRTNVFPHEICLSPDRNLAYLTEYGLPGVESEGTGGNTIAVVDIAKRKIIKRISTGNFRRPHGIVTHKNGQMWVTAEYNDKILSFDLRTEELRFSVPTVGNTPHIVTITPDGTQAISTHVFTGDIVLIDTKTGKINKRIMIGDRPEGLAFSKDGKTLFVANHKSNDIAVVDILSGNIMKRIQTGNGPVRLVATPKGDKIVTPVMYSNQAQVIDVASCEVVATIEVGEQPAGSTISPDGKYAFFACQAEDRIHIVSLETYKVENILSVKQNPDSMQCLTTSEIH